VQLLQVPPTLPLKLLKGKANEIIVTETIEEMGEICIVKQKRNVKERHQRSQNRPLE
jgi:hypothetical protein